MEKRVILDFFEATISIFHQCPNGLYVHPVYSDLLLTSSVGFPSFCHVWACSKCFIPSPTWISLSPFIFLLCFSLPWVGGHHWRWELSVWVCAGIHGNPVLIGPCSGRMIGSCCQWRLFVQTGSRLGQLQMGPSDAAGRLTKRIHLILFFFSLRMIFE